MAKLIIYDREFVFPKELNMGEQRQIKRYSGKGLSAFTVEEAMHDPDLSAAFVHILFAREAPQLPEKEIERRVNLVSTVTFVGDEEEDDADPPTKTPTPSEPPSESESSGESSGNGSGDSPVTIPVSTGTQG